MKYLIILFGLIGVAGIGKFAYENTKQIEVVKLQNSENVQISTTSIPESELVKLKNLINEKNSKSPLFADILDFSKKSNDIITEKNARDLIVMINENIVQLFDCLNKKVCAVDESIGQKVLARHLEIVKEILKHFPMYSSDVNWIIIKQANGISNDDVKLLSLDLLRNYDAKNNGAEVILKLAAAYSGRAKAEFFTNMGPDLLIDERVLFTSALKESLLKDDPKTVVLVVASMKQMKLKKVEVAEVSKSLCHFKGSEIWHEISESMKTQVAINVESICL